MRRGGLTAARIGRDKACPSACLNAFRAVGHHRQLAYARIMTVRGDMVRSRRRGSQVEPCGRTDCCTWPDNGAVTFVADDLGAWLVGLLADAGWRKLVAFEQGDQQERACMGLARPRLPRPLRTGVGDAD